MRKADYESGDEDEGEEKRLRIEFMLTLYKFLSGCVFDVLGLLIYTPLFTVRKYFLWSITMSLLASSRVFVDVETRSI